MELKLFFHSFLIEGYLESFCQWQAKENPEYWDRTSDHPDHWDHGLMLTGLDLYDGSPKQNSVIGLAWVSGMCHPEYSCTINEGNNFESVYVIAHEMGHNLGMNHDGETSSGNTCDPNTNLMSPVLGPGKVTWSSCSNQEINDFLSNRFQKISQSQFLSASSSCSGIYNSTSLKILFFLFGNFSPICVILDFQNS